LEIRRLMLPHLLTLVKTSALASTSSSSQAEVVREVQTALLNRLEKDPSVPFRMEVIQGLCNLSYQHRKILSKDLVERMGVQVLSKHKEERKNALTGLVQMYFRQYLKYHLQSVIEGGDDCPIECVLDALEQCCRPAPSIEGSGHPKNAVTLDCRRNFLSPVNRKVNLRQSRRSKENDDEYLKTADYVTRFEDNKKDEVGDDFEYYQWIPCLLFESASYTDVTDSEMRSRVFTLMDELILGSELPFPDNKRRLTSTARATGLAVVVDVIRKRGPLAWWWLGELLDVRAKLQTTLKAYIDARSEIRQHALGKKVLNSSGTKCKHIEIH